MKIISWNVNGFRARKTYFAWLDTVKPDVVCLQEVKAELDQATPFPIELMHYPYVYWNPSQTKKGYSGTAIFSKKEFTNVVNGIGIKEFDEEGRTIVVENEDFVLYNIYFPNSGQEGVKRLDYKITFNEALYEHVKNNIKAGKNIIITGDYNVAHKPIDIARPKENEGNAGYTKEEREWMDKFIELGMVDTFREYHPEPERYSWWNMRFGAKKRNIGWRIDYFCVNKEYKKHVTDADILDKIEGSDHAPILLTVK